MQRILVLRNSQNRGPGRRRLASVAARLLALGATLCLPLAAGDTIVWKPVGFPLLRVDGQAVKDWGVFRADKKQHLVLVRIGERFLMLDLEERRVEELAPRTLKRKGSDWHWDSTESKVNQPEAEPATANAPAGMRPRPARQILTSEDWEVRDVGFMQLIRVRLTTEGRTLEVQWPIPPRRR